MNKLLPILLICSISLTQELTVEGDLNVTGNIQNQTIDSLLQRIIELESIISQLQAQMVLIGGDLGYADCNGVAFGDALEDCTGVCNGDVTTDVCGDCDGDAISEDECGLCLLIEVELWGGCYTIEETIGLSLGGGNQLTGEIPPEIGNLTNLTHLDISNNQLTGSIPPEIGNLTNLTIFRVNGNQLTGEIPPEVCALIGSNNLIMSAILDGNNLINTCE